MTKRTHLLSALAGLVVALSSPAAAQVIDPSAMSATSGDTFKIRGGPAVRVKGIVAPQPAPRAACIEEARLAAASSARLAQLIREARSPRMVNAPGQPNADHAGRLLRDVIVDGRSVADILVAEGLAKRGRQASWC